MSKCQALDDNGKRCQCNAAKFTHYFGDREANQDAPPWVRVELCKKHAPKRARWILAKVKP